MKKILYYIIIACFFISCKKADPLIIDSSKYIFPIPQVNLTEDARVGAYYSVYKPADWNVARAHTPFLGQYDALTVPVMQQHIRWADTAGVNFFIFKWNGTA